MPSRDEREVKKAYVRAVFNVLFHNRADHPQSFAWRLGQEAGVPAKAAEAIIDRMLLQANTFDQRAAQYPIRRATVKQMGRR